MATVFRPTYSKPTPKDAEIVKQGAERFARFKVGARTVLAKLVKGKKGRCLVPTAEWYCRVLQADGTFRKVKGSTDRQATQEMGNRLERDAQKVANGTADKHATQKRKAIADHLKDFRRSLENAEAVERHIAETVAKLERVFDGCGFVQLRDLDHEAAESFLAAMRKAGRSVQTTNHYVAALRQFGLWLVGTDRVQANPFRKLEKLNVEPDRRRVRRALTPEQLQQLVAAADAGRTIQGVPGPMRGTVYMVAGFTGLRRGEIATLKVSDFDLDASVVTVRARMSKNRKRARLPLHPALLDRLRPIIEAARQGDPDALLFPIRDKHRRPADMIRVDLAAAGIPLHDEQGRVVDVHALRTSFGTNLARAGVSLATAKDLMRHSTAELTAAVYTELEITDLQAAVNQIPSPKT